MNPTIRQEQTTDHDAVFALIEAAFKDEEFTDHQEQFLVARLRKLDAFIPELSLVAELDQQVVGHILLTKVKIKGEAGYTDALALAPVSVLPGFQGKGIGGKLIERSHAIARELGHRLIVLLGHADYNPRFGYKTSALFGIQFPFEIPPENGMVYELVEGALDGVEGMIVYPEEFGVG